tara:strand:+ start:517 stop:1362 length:846 start_codon:yes stop_codon:yes gene_type:complete
MEEKDFKKFIIEALLEDVGEGDHSSIGSISQSTTNKAQLLIKEKGIIAGVELATMIFKQVDPNLKIDVLIKDGTEVDRGDIAFIIEGNSISILSGERVVLNCMQNMSAIATKTAYLKSLISETDCQLLDTRKTTPLNRKLEKWAVRIGGGNNHRFGLYDMIMIKDNHIDFAGGINHAIQKTKKYLKEKKKNLDIIVEARDIKEVKEILHEGGIKRILLDNFDYKTTTDAVNLIGNNCQTESSGGITEKTILEYAKCGVDFISIGALTNSRINFDLSLKAIT